jgi:hypothetical protein
MSEGFSAHGKMPTKCPIVIGRERSPLKNVQKMSHPYSVLGENVKKMSLAIVGARVPEEEKREISSRQSVSPTT